MTLTFGYRNVDYGYDADRRKVLFYSKVSRKLRQEIKRAHHQLRQKRMHQLIRLLLSHPSGVENISYPRKLRFADRYFGLTQQLIDEGLVSFEGLGPMWARVFIIDNEKLKRKPHAS